MNVRLAMKEDKEQVLKLFDEFASFLQAEDVPSQIGGTLFDEVINRKDIKIFLAEDNNQLVGYIQLILLPIIRHGSHYGHIEEAKLQKDFSVSILTSTR